MAARPRHALITGGSRGIGLAIAQLFAKQGIRCTLISRSEEDLQAAVATLQPLQSTPQWALSAAYVPAQTRAAPALPHDAHGYIAGDIATRNLLRFWSKMPSAPFTSRLPVPAKDPQDPSKIDILVNCAGTAQAQLFLRGQDVAAESIIAVNLTAMLTGTRFLIRHGYLRGRSALVRRAAKTPDAPLVATEDHDEYADEADVRGFSFLKSDGEAQRGSEAHQATSCTPPPHHPSPVAINVSSLLGVRGGFGATAYAASKAGVLGFTRALATEYSSHRVRVNAIVPGYISTDMTSLLDAEQLSQQIPLGRFGTAEEVAQAALFLADNEYAHNCVLNLDGGMSAV